MTNKEVKLILEGVIEKTKKSIESEKNYMRELTDDRAVLMHIETMESNGEPIPDDSGYESYTDWKRQVAKEITTGENSLKRIGIEKAELIAFEYYVETAPEA